MTRTICQMICCLVSFVGICSFEGSPAGDAISKFTGLAPIRRVNPKPAAFVHCQRVRGAACVSEPAFMGFCLLCVQDFRVLEFLFFNH